MSGGSASARSKRVRHRKGRGICLGLVLASFCCGGAACQFPPYFVTPVDADDAGASNRGGEQAIAGAQASGGTSGMGGGSAAGTSPLGGVSATAGGGGAGGTTLGGAAAIGGNDMLSGAAGQAGAGNDQNPLFFDDFESGAASQWLAIAGSSWSVVDEGSGKVYQQNPSFADFYAAVATNGTWTDQIIEAKVKVLNFGGASTSDVVTLYGRFSNIDNYFAAVLRPDGRVAIRASVGGAPPASIKTSPNFGVTTDVWYQLRFELLGSSLKLFVDGNLRVDTVDARLSQGTVAIGGTNTAAMFDDVRVTSP